MILAKIGQWPVTQWNYKNTPVPEPHIGPMAQDFKRLFDPGLADDDKSISTVDITGVALAGIKGLMKKNENLEKLVTVQQQQIELLKEEIEKIKKRIR